MTQSRAEVLNSFFSLELGDNDSAFIFLGYSGVILRTKNMTIMVDPGKSLDESEVSALEYLDLLFFTHNHWDHYNHDKALQIIKKTKSHVVADIISSKELNASLPPDMVTRADSGSFATTYVVAGHEIVALRGVHVGPITQYLMDLGTIKVFHAGDSGYWKHTDISAHIAFVPVGTARTCSPEVALGMVVNVQPKLAVPIHGKKQEMKKFQVLMNKVLPHIEVIVPEKFKLIRFTI
jgi:L-ascorbate metabolism protein UlaG (beta-lactamase superfamily)